MYITKQIPGFAAVSLEGPSANLQDAQASLKLAGLTVDTVGQNSILLRDVRESSMENVGSIAQAHALRVVGAYGKKMFIHREKAQTRKAFKLSLEEGKWYFAENLEETYPFIVVRDVHIEKTGNNGDEDQVLDLEFYSPDHAMPVRQTVTSREAAQYGLRPATEEDFEKVDMILPVSELSTLQLPNSDSHGIPDDTVQVDETPNPTPSQLPSQI
jgi:hypothetical protein